MTPLAPLKTVARYVPVPENDSTRSLHVPAAAFAIPRVSNRPGAAQFPLLAESMQRLEATTAPEGFTRYASRSGAHS